MRIVLGSPKLTQASALSPCFRLRLSARSSKVRYHLSEKTVTTYYIDQTKSYEEDIAIPSTIRTYTSLIEADQVFQ